jgi:hypothetical protein
MSTNSVEDHPIGCMACITCDAPPDDAALCDGCMEYDKKCGGTSYGLENVESGSAAYWKKRSASLLADILLQTSMRREEYLRHEQKKIGLRSGEDLWEYRWRVLQNLKKRARK